MQMGMVALSRLPGPQVSLATGRGWPRCGVDLPYTPNPTQEYVRVLHRGLHGSIGSKAAAKNILEGHR